MPPKKAAKRTKTTDKQKKLDFMSDAIEESKVKQHDHT